MRPDIHRLLILCKVFGFLPFQYAEGRIGFAWKSKQIFFFFMVLILGIANISYIYYVFIKTFIESGMSGALLWSPWVTGFTTPVLVQLIMLWRRKKLVEFLNRCVDLWAVYRLDPCYSVSRIMCCIHGFYVVFACLFTIISIAWLNWSQPGLEIFTSSLFCNLNSTCPDTITVLSMVQHSIWLFYGYLGYLIMDVLPMAIAIGMAKAFAVTNDHLEGKNRLRALIPLAKVIPKCNSSDSEETPQQCAGAQIALIRQTMAEHLRIQRCLAKFSPTFSPFIMLSVVYLFAMSVILFYSVIKNGIGNASDFIVYFSNGAQILLRGTMVLHYFGNVRERANDTRDLLHLQVGLLEELHKYDSSILMEVQVFTARMDNVVISAGPYFSCTHSFLMSFYGLLATYVIVLVQSPV